MHEMHFRSLITVQRLKVNLRRAHFNARAGNERAQRRGNLSSRMFIEGFKDEHTFRQDNGQKHNHWLTVIASFRSGLAF